jgi:hypothetical protein
MSKNAIIELAPTTGYYNSNIQQDDIIFRPTDPTQNILISITSNAAPAVTVTASNVVVSGIFKADTYEGIPADAAAIWSSNNFINYATSNQLYPDMTFTYAASVYSSNLSVANAAAIASLPTATPTYWETSNAVQHSMSNVGIGGVNSTGYALYTRGLVIGR